MSGPRVIVCASFPREGSSALHDLARGWREGRPGVRAAVEVLIVGGLAREAPELAAAQDVTLVAMAGHRAGGASDPAERLVAALAAAHSSWRVAEPLVRRSDVPSAMTGVARDAVAEAATLAWPPIRDDGPILLVDDVVRTGGSLEAAWHAAPPHVRDRLTALVAFRAEG